jgi:hypothetical protein
MLGIRNRQLDEASKALEQLRRSKEGLAVVVLYRIASLSCLPTPIHVLIQGQVCKVTLLKFSSSLLC